MVGPDASEERLLEIVDTIEALARLEFTTTARVSETGDIFDAVAAGVNMLGEELEAFRDDVEERAEALSKANAELAHRAFYDRLTGLANRALFRDRLTQALAGIEERHGMVALLAIDIDRFKEVNDSLGRETGDRMLVEVARRLEAPRGATWTAARTGGDEFAVLLVDATPLKAEELATALATRLREPFSLAQDGIRVSASIGIAVATAAQDPEDLMRNADVALSATKAARMRAPTVYVPGMHDPIARRLRLSSALRRAVEREELTLAYQPIVDLRTRSIIGFEALARWTDPDLGSVPPITFIPLAEQIGIMPLLGDWVLATACREAAHWRTREGKRPYVAVNLAAVQLYDPHLPERVSEILRETGLPVDALLLEMTESQLVEHAAETGVVLQGLHDLGLRVAIDDFGTGYSSLSYLRHLPVEVIKIDRSFIAGIGTESQEWKFAQSVVRLVKQLGLTTVAEGVEDAAQAAHARAIGCDSAQGYYFGRPLGAAAARASLAAQDIRRDDPAAVGRSLSRWPTGGSENRRKRAGAASLGIAVSSIE